MRGGLAALFAFLLFASAVAAAEQGRELLLELWVNGANKNVVAHVTEKDGALLISRDELLAGGVKVDAGEADETGLVALRGLAGVQVEIQEAEQRLAISADQKRLAPQIFSLRSPEYAGPPSSTTGFIASYDIAGTVGDVSNSNDTSALAAALAGTFFTPYGTLTSTGFGRWDGDSRFVRLDTTAEIDQPGALRRWLIGDAISGGLNWSRSVRFGGLQIATDFSLRPDLITLPLPAFFGESAVPATVDVFVNSARVFEGNLEPGPFQVRDLPVVTGSGQAVIVVRDLLGREITQSFSFFATNALLQQGLSAYDLDLGFLRQNYGERSFDYGDPLIAGTYRYGVTDWLTLETHGEATGDVQLAGAGAVFGLGAFGAAQAAASFSHRPDGEGALYSLSAQSQYGMFGFFGSVSATTGEYFDLASLDSLRTPRLRTQLGANLRLGRGGALAASWVSIKNDNDDATELATATYSLSFGNGWYFGATGLYDVGNKSWAAEAFLSIPIDGLLGSASVRTEDDATEVRAALTKPVNPDGGFGYRIMAATGENDIAEGQATWIGDHGSLDADVSSFDGRVAARLVASGAFVVMDGSLFATKKPNGSIALVKTGEADVRVYRENREVARADEDGEALLTNLIPYTANRIAVEPDDYPFATIVGKSGDVAVPRRQSGIVVDLAPAKGWPALVTLQLGDGNPPPVGAEVMLTGASEALVVGRHGEVFIPDLQRPAEGTVSYDKGSCHFSVTPSIDAQKNTIPRIGPIACVTDAAHEM